MSAQFGGGRRGFGGGGFGGGRGRGPKMEKEEPKEDYYKLLGVPKDADDKTIKKKFKKLAIKYHPDKNADNPEEAKK